MADEKKLKSEELTDEQANAAAGGIVLNSYICEGCGQSFNGRPKYHFNDKPCCPSCYFTEQSENHKPEKTKIIFD